MRYLLEDCTALLCRMLSAEKQGKRENGNVKGGRKTFGGGEQGVVKSKKQNPLYHLYFLHKSL